MRLSTIEHPPSLTMKLAYWLSRRQLGSVITPLKTVYARVPIVRWVALAINNYLAKGCGLPTELRFSSCKTQGYRKEVFPYSPFIRLILQKILDRLKGQPRVFVSLMFACGLRPGEALAAESNCYRALEKLKT